MKLLKQIWYAAAVAAITGVVYGCQESTTRPPPPPPPPPISLQLYNSHQNPDGAFYLVNDDVYDIRVDAQGRVWIATDEGVTMSDGTNKVSFFDDFNNIPNRKCRALAVINNRIYVGTWGGGAAFFDESVDPNMWTKIPVRGQGQSFGLSDGQVTSMATDQITAGTSYVWIATVNGLNRFVDAPPSNPVNASRFGNFTTRLGGANDITTVTVYRHPTRAREVWLSTRYAGIHVLRNTAAQDQHFRISNSAIPSNLANGVAVDPTTNLTWGAFSDRCVARVNVDTREWTYFTRLDGLDSDLASSIAVRPNGDIWIATQTGVSRRRPDGTITNYLKGSGLPESRVRKVYVDPNGDVWLGFIDGGAAKVLKPDA